MKTLLVALSIFFVLPATASDFVVAKNVKCKVYHPKVQRKIKVSWYGECVDGFASGLGVMRYTKGNKLDSVYYGQVKSGYWDKGVLDSPTGYKAGQFRDHQLQEAPIVQGTTDKSSQVEAFREGAKAAEQLAQQFEKKGNKSMASHYRGEAYKLTHHLDVE